MKARHKDTGEIIELAEEGIISCDGRRFCWYQVEIIPEPIDECKPSLPSNLDEAAEKYSNSIAFCGNDKEIKLAKEQSKCDFKAGAEWMAGQGVSIPGKVGIYGVDVERITKELWEDGFKIGEEVILQIRKKQ